MLKILTLLGLVSAVSAISCEQARWNCAFRTGCGNALQGYIMGCSAVLNKSPTSRCPKICQQALISLMSSDEGKELMSCECTDDVCRETKQRVEVCRPYVMKAVNEERPVSCEIAQWICASDASCATALEYYRDNCETVFSGRKCTAKCKNSIAILRKQEKAAKLNTCRCSGEEEYDCPRIRSNIAKLCFNKPLPQPPPLTHHHHHHHHKQQQQQTISPVDDGSNYNNDRAIDNDFSNSSNNNNNEDDASNQDDRNRPEENEILRVDRFDENRAIRHSYSIFLTFTISLFSSSCAKKIIFL